MSVKQLAKQLPLYGQQAISSALTALSVAGHLRRVRCPVGAREETRWVFRTFWSRTARDNEWWTTFLAAETATAQATHPSTAPAPPLPPPSKAPRTEQAPEPTPVPQQHTPPPRPETPLAPSTTEPGPSPAYLALARLGRNDHRLALSADDCTALEPQATQWLARGVSVDYLTSALTAGLPATIDSPAGFLRRRLTTKIPPQLPTEKTNRAPPPPPPAASSSNARSAAPRDPPKPSPTASAAPAAKPTARGPGTLRPRPPQHRTSRPAWRTSGTSSEASEAGDGGSASIGQPLIRESSRQPRPTGAESPQADPESGNGRLHGERDMSVTQVSKNDPHAV